MAAANIEEEQVVQQEEVASAGRDLQPEVKARLEPEDKDAQMEAELDTLPESRLAPDTLSTQVMAPVSQDGDQAATQMMISVEPNMLATQVMLPAETTAAATAAAKVAGETSAVEMDAEKQVEFQKPTAQKQLARPRSAYQIFVVALRKEVGEEIGTTNLPKVQVALAEKWRNLDEVQKAVYAKQAEEEKETYKRDLADGGIPAPKKKVGKKRGAAAKKATAAAKKAAKLRNLKRRAGPKRPRGSYSIWLAEHRKGIRNKLAEENSAEPSFKEIARAAGKAWLALTDAQKAPYVERSRALAAKFKDINKACKEYKKANVRDTKKKAAAAKAKTSAKKAGKSSAPKGSESAKRVATPQKSSAGTKSTPPKKAKKAPEVQTAYLDMTLMAEAEKAGFAGTFQKLAEREDMRSFPQRKLLDALVANGGLLHRAKDAVLSGSA